MPGARQSSVEWFRFTSTLSPEGRKLLEEFEQRHPEVVRSALVEAIIRFVPEEVLVEASAKLKAMKEAEVQERRQLREMLATKLRSIPADKLRELLEHG